MLFRNTVYAVNGKEYTRSGLVKMLSDYICENNITSDMVPNWLPQYSLEKNLEHHPVRIARNLGFDIAVVE